MIKYLCMMNNCIKKIMYVMVIMLNGNTTDKEFNNNENERSYNHFNLNGNRPL